MGRWAAKTVKGASERWGTHLCAVVSSGWQYLCCLAARLELQPSALVPFILPPFLCSPIAHKLSEKKDAFVLQSFVSSSSNSCRSLGL